MSEAVTNGILAVAAFGFGFLIFDQLWARRLFAFGFFAIGVASAGAAIVHWYSLPDESAVWLITIYAIGFGAFFSFAGVARAFFANPVRRILAGLALVQLVVYGVLVTGNRDFTFVLYEYGVELFIVLLIAGWVLLRGISRSSALWLLGAVSISLLAALFQQSDIAVAKTLTHNDVYHIVQIGALYCFYKAATFFEEARTNEE